MGDGPGGGLVTLERKIVSGMKMCFILRARFESVLLLLFGTFCTIDTKYQTHPASGIACLLMLAAKESMVKKPGIIFNRNNVFETLSYFYKNIESYLSA